MRALFGLSPGCGRRVSWADSDIILDDGTRIEVKANALWQSWKLVNEDGTRKPCPSPALLNPAQVRFNGLQAKTAISPSLSADSSGFKSAFYVFCFQNQTDPSAWDAWNLMQWEFYLMTKAELTELNIGKSISLATLRSVRPPMSASAFQTYAKDRIGALAKLVSQ